MAIFTAALIEAKGRSNLIDTSEIIGHGDESATAPRPAVKTTVPTFRAYQQLWHYPGRWQARRKGCHAVPTAAPVEQAVTALSIAGGPQICGSPGCSKILHPRRGGGRALYCSGKCRVRAHRARKLNSAPA
jgi:hypothetical protein